MSCREFFRVMRPGAYVRIIVPDAEIYLTAARAYGKWLDVRSAAKSAGAQFGVSSVRIDCDDLPSLPALLRQEYERMVAGDLLLLDIRAENTMTRDSLATALFRGGFERPLMWGGRKALVAELQRGRWLGARLPAKALGAGPDRIPEIADDLVPPPDRIYAIARRSALAPPDQRPLRLSIVMPVYNERQTFRDVMEALLANCSLNPNERTSCAAVLIRRNNGTTSSYIFCFAKFGNCV